MNILYSALLTTILLSNCCVAMKKEEVPPTPQNSACSSPTTQACNCTGCSKVSSTTTRYYCTQYLLAFKDKKSSENFDTNKFIQEADAEVEKINKDIISK